ncbi:MAG: DNA-processing protein DprA [Nitrososphaerales archaeon]
MSRLAKDSRGRDLIVGSRKATSRGITAAKEIASYLVRKEVVIISGLAEGIDTSAHKAAIEQGGFTIAVRELL